MNKANYSKSRAFGLPVFGLLFLLAFSSSSFAQNAIPDGASSASVAASAGSPVDREIAKAEALFKSGQDALSENRDAEARTAFDATLDVFVRSSSGLTADPKFQAAYHGFVDRIWTAEVAAGPNRAAVPTPPLVRRPTVEGPTADEQVQGKAEGILADMGAKIEDAKPTEEARQTNQAVLGSEAIDLPIEMNDQVLGAIDLYSGRFNKWFAQALSRGLPQLPRIREILAQAGLPQDLAYVPIVESAFNPIALSSAKAKGLWQFMPATGKQYGLKQDFFVDERSDMEKATVAAAQYLKNLYALFGDWNLALAGYNAGEGNVQRAIRRAQTNDFWALAKTKSFRAETKNYVPLIHAAIVIAKSPESYGIDVLPAELASSETVRVAGSYPIATVARCANTEAAEIKRLNPELRRGMTPASAFDLDVPHGSGEQVSACLASEKAMNFTRHVVRKRDTLSLIATMFGVSASEIARANGLAPKARLKPGTELAIPRSNASPKGAVMMKASTNPGTNGPSYKIRRGDTLSSVAARFSTSVSALMSLNNLRSHQLSIGQVVRVSGTFQSASRANE
ncbi:MAG: LysM peptidoglycan-binding domain-containing protein [Vicinamibacteria bacterium]